MIELKIVTSLHCLHRLREFTLNWPVIFFLYNPSLVIQHDAIALPLPFNYLLLLSHKSTNHSSPSSIYLVFAFSLSSGGQAIWQVLNRVHRAVRMHTAAFRIFKITSSLADLNQRSSGRKVS